MGGYTEVNQKNGLVRDRFMMSPKPISGPSSPVSLKYVHFISLKTPDHHRNWDGFDRSFVLSNCNANYFLSAVAFNTIVSGVG